MDIDALREEGAAVCFVYRDGARGACGVGDSECTLGSELKFGDALGLVKNHI